MFGILASYIFQHWSQQTKPRWRCLQEALNDDMIFYNLKHKNSLFWTPVLDDSSIGNHLELKRPRASDDIWPAVYRWQWICFQMMFSQVCHRKSMSERGLYWQIKWSRCELGIVGYIKGVVNLFAWTNECDKCGLRRVLETDRGKWGGVDRAMMSAARVHMCVRVLETVLYPKEPH